MSGKAVRIALLNDIPELHHIRLMVRENRLSRPDRVTEAMYQPYLTTQGRGWLCEENNEVVGFAILDVVNASVWALFVRPDREAEGIGSLLHDAMIDYAKSRSLTVLTLSTEPKTRAANFYRTKGWQEIASVGPELSFRFTLG